ncbi:ArsR family transcriptional regulator [Staphylothermus marinus]|uniref:ArsR/SmtB family transcription factor n=1 Tax=Staphylothermus marinus TaxID=2280 RepID=UPI00146ED347
MLSQIELPVCIISSILGLEQSLVSHHLAVLRRANIVGTKNVGKYRFYYLKTNSLLESILNKLR